MKYLKKFESEIYVGTISHFNSFKPANQQIYDLKKLTSYLCNNCNFEFSSEDENQNLCSVCLSKDIVKTK